MQFTNDGQRLLRARGAARFLGVGLTLFWSMVKRPGFPASVQVSPGVRCWDVEDLNAWIESRKTAAAAAEPDETGEAANASY